MYKTLLILGSLILSQNIFSQLSKKVLIIGIDGTRWEALEEANTPNIDGLINNGIYSPHGLNDDITISGPAWSAILCGVWSDKHLVTGNDFMVDNYMEYPSLFRHVEEFNPDLNTVSFCHWNPINDEIIQDDVDFKINVDSDQELSDQTSSYILANDPDLMFIHFDDVDGVGHGYGFSSDITEYMEAIEQVDEHLTPILQAIENRPSYDEEDWLIIVTPDHGGLGFNHGGITREEQECFLIISGNSIPQELIEKECETLAPPENCLNHQFELTFDGDGDYIQTPIDDAFNFGSDQDFTVECRVRTTQAADASILGNKDWDSGINPGYVFSFVYPNGPEWKVNIGDGGNRVDLESGGQIADGQWHTLSVSFDRDGMMKMFEDGNFLDEADISGIGNINSYEGVFAGADFFGAYEFSGSIAEVRVWNELLDENTISDWSCESIENTHPNFSSLIGYWKMDEPDEDSPTLVTAEVGEDAFLIGAEYGEPEPTIECSYDNTPRLVDVPYTAFSHLCIPISEEWELDGRSWIEENCESNSVGILNDKSILIHPNPTEDFLQFISIGKSASPINSWKIHDSLGNIALSSENLCANEKIYVGYLASGIYYVEINNGISTKAIKMIKL